MIADWEHKFQILPRPNYIEQLGTKMNLLHENIIVLRIQCREQTIHILDSHYSPMHHYPISRLQILKTHTQQQQQQQQKKTVNSQVAS